MKKIILILGIVVLFTACKNNNTSTETTENTSVISDIKKAITGDGLKSAIYESETLMPGGMGTSINKVIFDDYGKKTRSVMESTITFGGKSMNSSNNSLRLDGYVYVWKNGAKTGSKIKLDGTKFDPNNTDFSKLSDEMKKEMNIVDEGTETVNGKECKVISFSVEQSSGKIWTWYQIPVKVEVSLVGKKVTTTLKSLEENPTIPAGTFDVPADVDFKEMNLPATAEK